MHNILENIKKNTYKIWYTVLIITNSYKTVPIIDVIKDLWNLSFKKFDMLPNSRIFMFQTIFSFVPRRTFQGGMNREPGAGVCVHSVTCTE